MNWASAQHELHQGRAVARTHWHWCWIKIHKDRLYFCHDDHNDKTPFSLTREDAAATDWYLVYL